MTIEDILKEKQPEVFKELNARPRGKRKRKRRGSKTDHLSFYSIDKLMRERVGIDSTRCRGR